MEEAYIYKDPNKNNLTLFTFKNDSNQTITIPFSENDLFDINILDTFSVEEETFRNAKISGNKTYLKVGQVINSVWRPGLYYGDDYFSDLAIKKDQLARSKRDLKLLVQKLDDILLYLEPNEDSLKCYSHKLRELLILACTEVENSWIYYIKLSDLNVEDQRLSTNDYFKLCDPLYLKEFEVIFTRYPFKKSFLPFKNWNKDKPTSSLIWYDDYNKAKHNKDSNFNRANLENCLNALAANIILYCVRFHPYSLINEKDDCSNLINEHFKIKLNSPNHNSFYIPSIKLINRYSGVFSGPDEPAKVSSWQCLPFTLGN